MTVRLRRTDRGNEPPRRADVRTGAPRKADLATFASRGSVVGKGGRLPVRIATAGWANPPAERAHRRATDSHLEHYARQFNAVEINSTFYRSHKIGTYERWRETTPADFAFAVKMARSITHDCGLRGCKRELQAFLREVSALGSKLRVILIQLPPSLEFDAKVAGKFFSYLDAVDCQLACEPRHASWFGADADRLLREHEISRVAADPARQPGALVAGPLAIGGYARLSYYRLHGSPRMYYSAYSDEFLRDLASQIDTPRRGRKEVWCVFDNTARHEAWSDGIRLKGLLAGASRLSGGASKM
jgi:uncharacterized protein YecE (DUF72 family)